MSKPKYLHLLWLLVFVFIQIHPKAQEEASQWFLRVKQHYSFNKNGFTNLPATPFQIDDPVTSISDSAGNLLFISSGRVIYDRNYKPLPFFKQTTELSSVTNNIYFVRKPGSQTQFYFFYNTSINNSYLYGVAYALVDLSLNNGYGDVIESNVEIDRLTSAGFTVVKASGDEFWLVTHTCNTNIFKSWKVTAAGLSAVPVKSTAGMDKTIADYEFNHLKTSPNGKFIAGVTSHYYPGQFPYTRRFTEVYNFNAATGKLTTRVKSFNDGNVGYADDNVEFSPDSRLLYVKWDYAVSGLQPCGFTAGNIWQYNLCYTDSVSFSNYTTWLSTFTTMCGTQLWGRLELAPDKKIYMPRYSGYISAASIQNPNVIGSFSNFTISTSGFNTEGSNLLPDFYHDYLAKAVGNNITYSGGCYPSPVTFNITNDTLKYIQWNFDDAASANNLSTLINPSHIFSKPGFYNVSAILYSEPGKPFDTVYDQIEIKDPTKRLLAGLPKDTSMCYGNYVPVKLSVINGIFYWRKRYKGTLDNLECSDSILIGDWGDGTYIVEMHQNDCDGCILRDSITYHTLKTPEIYLADSTAFCNGDSVQLSTYNPGAATIWSTGDTTQNIWVKKPGSYWVQAEYTKTGCTVSDTIKINSYPKVQFTLPADTTLCNNETLLLDPQVKNAYYRWQDKSEDQTYLVHMPGKYWVTITNYDGCSTSDTIRVSYVSADAVNLGNDTSLCAGDSLLLQSNINNAGFLWSTGATSSSVYVNKTGDYWVRASNGSCTVADTIHVIFNKKPVFSFGSDTSLCEKQMLLLNPGLSGNYLWQDGTTANNYVVSNAGLYWLQLTQNGCTASDSITVMYKPLPTVYLGNDTGLCEGELLTLDAYNASISSYVWQDNSTQPNCLVTKAGTYFVNVTAYNGCTNSDTINITVTQPPAFSLGADTVLCDGTTLHYNFNIAGASYLWNDGSTNSQYAINTAGNYWLKVLQAGCSSNDTIRVDYKSVPIVNLGSDTTLCEGASYTLNALNTGASYLWQDNSTQPAYTVLKPGAYSVQVNLNDCTIADTIVVYYKTNPVFSLGDDSIICPGVPLTLSAATPGALLYKWQDGSTADHYIVSAPGLYSVQVTNECGTTIKAINVTNALCELEMPNAFTPNNDGMNDKFGVKYPQFLKAFHIIIYNRWGSKVFETTNPYIKWDGTVNGNAQNIGSYVWVINFTDNNNKQQTAHGMVTLLR